MKRKPYFKGSTFLRCDSLPIPGSLNEVRLFSVVRNEALRLPYFFKYYRRLGVDRFFVIDNNSTDATSRILLSQDNTHVFKTTQSYGKSGCGHKWLLSLLDQYGRNRWCVVVDADELLYYPYCEQIPIKRLGHSLESRGCNTLFSFLLDMYPKKPLYTAHYTPGKDFLSAARYFDGDVPRIPKQSFFGGMRQRVFRTLPHLWKLVFLKYTQAIVLGQGCHTISGAKVDSSISGCVLHFKYFSDFIARCKEEARREEHWDNGIFYKNYWKILKKNPKLSLYYSNSKRFRDTVQLIKLGFMADPGEFSRGLKKNTGRIKFKGELPSDVLRNMMLLRGTLRYAASRT